MKCNAPELVAEQPQLKANLINLQVEMLKHFRNGAALTYSQSSPTMGTKFDPINCRERQLYVMEGSFENYVHICLSQLRMILDQKVLLSYSFISRCVNRYDVHQGCLWPTKSTRQARAAHACKGDSIRHIIGHIQLEMK